MHVCMHEQMGVNKLLANCSFWVHATSTICKVADASLSAP